LRKERKKKKKRLVQLLHSYIWVGTLKADFQVGMHSKLALDQSNEWIEQPYSITMYPPIGALGISVEQKWV
jgi:hypothetical protein